jgi:type I restriction enzyme, S subunit
VKMVPLGEIAEVISGATPKTGVADYWDGDVLWATPADLSKLNTAYIETTPRTITGKGLASCAATILPPGAVLLSSRAPIGHVAINTAPMATNQGFKSLVPDPESLDAKYLYHWLKSKTKYLQSLGNGATFKEISKATVSKIEIPLPPLDEQRRIAAILDNGYALRIKRRTSLDCLDELTKAVFDDIFGDLTTNVNNYPIRLLEHWVDPKRPITYGILKPGPDIAGGVPYVRVADMKPAGIDLSSVRSTSTAIAHEYRRSTLASGDLLMSIRGHVGRFAFVPNELAGGNITQDSARLAIDDPVSAIYVRAAMEAPGLQQWMARRTKGAAVRGINLGDLREAPIPDPPRSHQEHFASAQGKIARQSELCAAQLEAVDLIFASLQSRAFRGEL